MTAINIIEQCKSILSEDKQPALPIPIHKTKDEETNLNERGNCKMNPNNNNTNEDNDVEYYIEPLRLYSFDGELLTFEVPAKFKCLECGKVYSYATIRNGNPCMCESPCSALVTCMECCEEFGEHEVHKHKCKHKR